MKKGKKYSTYQNPKGATVIVAEGTGDPDKDEEEKLNLSVIDGNEAVANDEKFGEYFAAMNDEEVKENIIAPELANNPNLPISVRGGARGNTSVAVVINSF